jgi:hypothetical protein
VRARAGPAAHALSEFVRALVRAREMREMREKVMLSDTFSFRG